MSPVFIIRQDNVSCVYNYPGYCILCLYLPRILKQEAPSAQCAAVMIYSSEMMDPPQNQASSMKRATCQGHSFSAASWPPTIRSLPGFSRPQMSSKLFVPALNSRGSFSSVVFSALAVKLMLGVFSLYFDRSFGPAGCHLWFPLEEDGMLWIK